jgi:alpha-tubulin suppressor-like RCC1 family protein
MLRPVHAARTSLASLLLVACSQGVVAPSDDRWSRADAARVALDAGDRPDHDGGAAITPDHDAGDETTHDHDGAAPDGGDARLDDSGVRTIDAGPRNDGGRLATDAGRADGGRLATDAGRADGGRLAGDAGRADGGRLASDAGLRDGGRTVIDAGGSAGSDGSIPDERRDSGAACTDVSCAPPSRIATVATGAEHTCALDLAGGAYCWGRNATGQLGDGTLIDRYTPTVVEGVTDAVEITAGDAHTCARSAAGTVSCWGANLESELGDASVGHSALPLAVAGIRDAVEIAAGGRHTCARRATGGVICWGRTDEGQLGHGSTLGPGSPATVYGLGDAVEIASGATHSCARRATGAVVCWGSRGHGETGDGTTHVVVPHAAPVEVADLVDAAAVAAGTWYSCAARATGDVLCWGDPTHGQLGRPGISYAEATVPGAVLGLEGALDVSSGVASTCALLATRAVCWGSSASGQLGNGLAPIPDGVLAQVTDLTDAVEISATRGHHRCARRATGDLVCWGRNLYGQLGDGTVIERPVPTAIVPP